jgi:hypothetical protein
VNTRRIRHDADRGRFCLIDLSSLGTTVDGVPVPRGYDEADGSKREKRRRGGAAASARASVSPTSSSWTSASSADVETGMTLLLLARFVLLAAIAAVAGLTVWAGRGPAR